MERKELVSLLYRAAAMAEGSADLTQDDINDLIEDLVVAATDLEAEEE